MGTLTCQKDKEGNIVRMRIEIEGIDDLQKDLTQVPDDWTIRIFLKNKETGDTVGISRYGKKAYATQLKHLQERIADKIKDGISWNEAFYEIVSNIREFVDEYDEPEYMPLPSIEMITNVTIYAERPHESRFN